MKKLFMETTSITEEKTIAQIQQTLSQYGVTAMLTEYASGKVESLSFKLRVDGHEIPFKMPCRWRAVAALLNKKRGLAPTAPYVEDRARRVAWRQVFRWIQAQCAMIETGMVKIEEVFLPYMQMRSGVTFYEQVKAHGSNLLSYQGDK